jgi:hypothetical protein
MSSALLTGSSCILRDRGCSQIEAAEDAYRRPMCVAEELGMRPLVAHCHLDLGGLYLRTDKREQAREHLATATTMYREMEMRFWLDGSTRRWSRRSMAASRAQRPP